MKILGLIIRTQKQDNEYFDTVYNDLRNFTELNYKFKLSLKKEAFYFVLDEIVSKLKRLNVRGNNKKTIKNIIDSIKDIKNSKIF